MNYPLQRFPVRFRHALRGLSLTLALCALSLSASAQERTSLKASFAGDTGQPVKVDVLVGQSRVIDFDQAYERVSISDPKTVEVVPISPTQVLINGLTFGQVNLVAWSKRASATTDGQSEPRPDSKMIVFDIYVQANISLIDNQIKVLFPKENIQLSQANGSVVLSGSVTNPALSEQAQRIIEAAGFKDKVVNLLRSPVLDAAQVQMQIRVAEVNRSILREVGAAYGIVNSTLPAFISPGGPAAFGSSNLTNEPGKTSSLTFNPSSAMNIFLGNINSSAVSQGFIRALHSRGALRDLAEPNLIAMHGQKANFLAGGEFPVPIIQSVSTGQNAITVVFKEFGIKLAFTPTIIDENHIRLEMEPEVSSLDFGSGVQVQGLVIPGLRVRRAKTVLELRDGQSFALAGLIDNREQVNLSKIPLLGDIPILGELFKSRSFQRSETELMFLVTVKMVEPLNPDQLPTLPGASDLRKSALPPTDAAPTTFEGQSGHSVPRKSGEVKPPTAPKAEEVTAAPKTEPKTEKTASAVTPPPTATGNAPAKQADVPPGGEIKP
jgi:pilus assembly protein CpaC